MAQFLAFVGVVLLIFGGYEIFNAMQMGVTVDSGGQEIANLQAMQIQFMRLVFGCALGAMASIFIVGSCLVEKLSPPSGSS